MATLSLRIDLGPNTRIGPGKILLLERIDETGSISAAGRSLGMSYKRAWDLVNDLNTSFVHPVVSAQVGGKSGGGATLTDFGRDLVGHYRAIEAKAERSAIPHIEALEAARIRSRRD